MSGEELKEKLVRRYGLGASPLLRTALYDRLAEIVELHGERAVVIIATVVDDSLREGITDKGRYFAFVVTKRLQDRGIIPKPEI